MQSAYLDTSAHARRAHCEFQNPMRGLAGPTKRASYLVAERQNAMRLDLLASWPPEARSWGGRLQDDPPRCWDRGCLILQAGSGGKLWAGVVFCPAWSCSSSLAPFAIDLRFHLTLLAAVQSRPFA